MTSHCWLCIVECLSKATVPATTIQLWEKCVFFFPKGSPGRMEGSTEEREWEFIALDNRMLSWPKQLLLAETYNALHNYPLSVESKLTLVRAKADGILLYEREKLIVNTINSTSWPGHWTFNYTHCITCLKFQLLVQPRKFTLPINFWLLLACPIIALPKLTRWPQKQYPSASFLIL